MIHAVRSAQGIMITTRMLLMAELLRVSFGTQRRVHHDAWTWMYVRTSETGEGTGADVAFQFHPSKYMAELGA